MSPRPSWPDGAVEMIDVREYADGSPVLFVLDAEAVAGIEKPDKRIGVQAFNQAGYDCTTIDLLDLIAWLRSNRPELLGPTDEELEAAYWKFDSFQGHQGGEYKFRPMSERDAFKAAVRGMLK